MKWLILTISEDNGLIQNIPELISLFTWSISDE